MARARARSFLVKLDLQSFHHLVAKVSVVQHVSEHVEADEATRHRACHVAGDLSEVGPIHIHVKDRWSEFRQAEDLFLAFLPACRAGNSEEFRSIADHISVNDEALFFGADQNGDSVTVVVARKALVSYNTSSIDV